MKKTIFTIVILLYILSAGVIAQSMIVGSTSKDGLKDPMLYISLGDYLSGQGNSAMAMLAYEKALEIEPGNIQALNNLGFQYKETNPLLAEDYFKRAIAIDPDYEAARNNLALLYNSLGKYDLACDQLDVLVKAHPEDIHYTYDLAINLAKKYYYNSRSKEDLSSSIVYFKKAYDENPGFEHSMDNIKVLEDIRREIEKA